MIEITDVFKRYGSFQVLERCTTRVTKGEVVVICGPLRPVRVIDRDELERQRNNCARTRSRTSVDVLIGALPGARNL